MEFKSLEYARLTDVGGRRSHNQDSFAVLPAEDEAEWAERGGLFLVADGMGAHAVGEMASKIAADLIPHLYQKHASDGPPKALVKAFLAANAAIYRKGQENPDFEGMGTTSTALLLGAEGGWIAHVGDSRAYRIRGDNIEQITFDHSLQWELARRQRTRPEKITGVPSNVILRSLGPDSNIQVDIEGPHTILSGDIFLLCTDGLSGLVSDVEIAVVSRSLPPMEASRVLVDIANMRGGPDNITVVLVRVPGEPDPEALKDAKRGIPLPGTEKRLEWPGVSIAAGVMLSALSVLFSVIGLHPVLPFSAFAGAFGFLAVGFLGVFKNYRREKELNRQREHRPPKTYRQAPVEIGEGLNDTIRQTVNDIEKRAKTNEWKVDQESRNLLRERREENQAAGNHQEVLDSLIEEICLFADAFRDQSNRAERFQPHWLKRGAK